MSGVTAREAGVTMAANLSDCAHRQIEPVDLLTGETVAALCADCLIEVPLTWLHMQRYSRASRQYAELARELAHLAP